MQKNALNKIDGILHGLDGNWLLHRMFHTAHPGQRDLGDVLAHSFLGKVCSEVLAVRATRLLVAFDGDEVFRYDIFSDYKGQRGDNSEVYEHLPKVLSLLTVAGIPWVQRKKFEADDILSSMSTRAHKVVLSTRDKDAYQYLRPGVRLYDSSFKNKSGESAPRFITHKDVEIITGLPPSLMIQYQALVGDKVDNIPQLLSPAKAKNGLLQHGSIRAWALADAGLRNELRAVRAELELNRKLVTMDLESLPADFEFKPVQKCSRADLPKSYYAMLNMLYPKSRGLF